MSCGARYAANLRALRGLRGPVGIEIRLSRRKKPFAAGVDAAPGFWKNGRIGAKGRCHSPGSFFVFSQRTHQSSCGVACGLFAGIRRRRSVPAHERAFAADARPDVELELGRAGSPGSAKRVGSHSIRRDVAAGPQRTRQIGRAKPFSALAHDAIAQPSTGGYIRLGIAWVVLEMQCTSKQLRGDR